MNYHSRIEKNISIQTNKESSSVIIIIIIITIITIIIVIIRELEALITTFIEKLEKQINDKLLLTYSSCHIPL